MSNIVSADYSNKSHTSHNCNVRDNEAGRHSIFDSGMGAFCLLFFLGTLLLCSCTGPRFPSASQSPKDPYAENGPKTKEEEAYYQDVYSGEWREQTGPFGFAKSIGKKSGSKTMPPHWAMMPHGAKTMSEIKAETAMRQTDRLAYNSYASAPGQPVNQPAYNPVSMTPAPYAQMPAPTPGAVPGTFQNGQAAPAANPAPNYIAPTYNGQGQFVPAVVEQPVTVNNAAQSTLPPYNHSPQNTQNPPYALPPAVASQGQMPGATGATLPPVRFPAENQPQTIPQSIQQNMTQNAPVVKTSEAVTVPTTGSATPFLPPTGTTPAPAPAQKEQLPQTAAPDQATPASPAQSPFPMFNGFSSPVSSHSGQYPFDGNREASDVFFSDNMIIRGQAPAAQGTDDLFDSPAAAPATVPQVPSEKAKPAPTQSQSDQDQSGFDDTNTFSERLGGRPLPLKIDPKLEMTWKSLSTPKTNNATDGQASQEGVAQSGRFLPGACPDQSGELPPYASVKKACPKYGRDGKAIPGFAPYEYIMDGSDSKGEAYATPDWNVHHLDQEDTIAHFDTVDGKILVEPSNRVCIYSPRFGSVRQIIGLRESDQNLLLHNAETSLGAASSRKLAAIDVRSQDEKVKHTLVETRLSGMAAKDLGHSLSGEVAVMENEQEIYLGDMMSYIQHNTITDDVKASLARGMQAAQNWGSMESVKIAIGEVFATANVYMNSPMTMYHVENGTKSSKLRLIKIASKDAAQPGELIEFVLRYENVGDQVIGNVTLLDNLSTRLVYVDRSAKSSRKGEFLVKENKQGSFILRWEITEPLKPGEFGIVEFICKVR